MMSSLVLESMLYPTAALAAHSKQSPGVVYNGTRDPNPAKLSTTPKYQPVREFGVTPLMSSAYFLLCNYSEPMSAAQLNKLIKCRSISGSLRELRAFGFIHKVGLAEGSTYALWAPVDRKRPLAAGAPNGKA